MRPASYEVPEEEEAFLHRRIYSDTWEILHCTNVLCFQTWFFIESPVEC